VIRLRVGAAAVALATLAASVAAAELEPPLVVVSGLLGCAPSDRDRLARGEIVSIRRADNIWDEAAAVIVDASPEESLQAMHRADFFHADRRVAGIQDVSAEAIDASLFSSLPIDTAQIMESTTGEPGAEWNFSATERALLRDLERDGGGRRGLAAALRHILAERAAAYRSGGTRAVASYVKAGGVGIFAAGSELATLWSRYAEIDPLAPGIHAAVASFPRSASFRLRHSFFASVIMHGQRPALVLSHRAESSRKDCAIAVEREFYVSRVYGVRQTILGAAELSGGRSVAFYLTSVAGAEPQPPVATAGERPSRVVPLLAQLRAMGARAR
jgi:hypothetical protein